VTARQPHHDDEETRRLPLAALQQSTANAPNKLWLFRLSKHPRLGPSACMSLLAALKTTRLWFLCNLNKEPRVIHNEGRSYLFRCSNRPWFFSTSSPRVYMICRARSIAGLL
jgi:hypothetical protein